MVFVEHQLRFIYSLKYKSDKSLPIASSMNTTYVYLYAHVYIQCLTMGSCKTHD